MKVIETTDNRFYRVEEIADPCLSHLYLGVAVKRFAGGFVDRKGAKPETVRREGCRDVAWSVIASPKE